ncbi:hypothetical protein C7T96_16100 [Nitratireductor sp. StC3]|nr:hypothetical protein C7T96_16100 [Nitratireductor sp. StC3]
MAGRFRPARVGAYAPLGEAGLADACLHAAAETLVDVLAGQVFEPIGKARLTKVSLLLNGLVKTADWIASGFPAPETSARQPFGASAYWDAARAMAHCAIRVNTASRRRPSPRSHGRRSG